MTLHWGIATLEGFFLLGMQPFCLIHRIGAHLSWSRFDFFKWPSCQGILLLVDDGFFFSHCHPSEEIRHHFSHWSMMHNWYISFGVLCIGAYFSVDVGF